MSFKALTANVYQGNPTPKKAADKILDISPLVVMMQEANQDLDLYRDRLDPVYRCHVNRAGYGSREVPVFVKDKHPNEGAGAVFACPEVPGSKVGKERWNTHAVTWLDALDRRAVFIGTHLNASIQNDDGTPRPGPVLDNYIRHANRLKRLIKLWQTDAYGWPVIVGADFNYRLRGQVDKPAETPDWSPYGIARACGLKYVAHGVDGFLYDPAAFTVTSTRTISKGETGSDHEWFLVTFDTKGE